ncbi:hypothetical protein, partial [Nonomuraea jabiensis]|uniref:hypothetical protein n=1 Tax=Nonomuraea jabiensis TaxID=882448 RepID=UPI00369EDD77
FFLVVEPTTGDFFISRSPTHPTRRDLLKHDLVGQSGLGVAPTLQVLRSSSGKQFLANSSF